MPRSGPTVLVHGLGLMGGSLAAALSAAGWTVLLHHRRPEVAHDAARRGYGTAIEALAEAAIADIAVVCTPVGTIPVEVRRVMAATRAIVTDVGSTKGTICRDLADQPRFVGSHPMAGSHLQGLAAADARLYHGRLAIVTPTPATPAAALALVEQLWAAVGSRVVRLDPDLHDRAVAQASHLPHLLACAAAAQLGGEAAPLAASGFRDTTRVAAGSPKLWADILAHNAPAVGAALDLAMAGLIELRAALARGDAAALEAWLEAARAGRSRFERSQGDAPAG